MIIDHVALEVHDIDGRVRRLEAAGLRVLRRGARHSTGQRIVMMGDGTGNKLELIEAGPGTESGHASEAGPATECGFGTETGPGTEAGHGTAPVFAHLALRTDDADEAYLRLQAAGFQSRSEPHDLPAARARSALLDTGDGFRVQVVCYAGDSPDAITWQPDTTTKQPDQVTRQPDATTGDSPDAGTGQPEKRG